MVDEAVTLTRIAADKGRIIGQSALKHELMEVPMRRLGDLISRRAVVTGLEVSALAPWKKLRASTRSYAKGGNSQRFEASVFLVSPRPLGAFPP
jgi:hypothetical protein